jgi:ubiquinone/menaquinone biosynthesis C-methylase UbiE
VTQFEELKARTSAAWSSAPWEQVAHMLAPIHMHLVQRLAPERGDRWLDLATGSGAVAVLAARAGAETTGIDYAPGLIESARRNADEKGLDVRFAVADVEDLPFDDESFDVLSSSMGMIFAPDHEAVAREAARVCARGGRLGFTAWEPGTAYSVVTEKYRPPPEPGAGDSDDWFHEEYVRERLGDAFELEVEQVEFRFAPEPGETVWERVTFGAGPMKALAASLDPEEHEQLHREFVEYVDGFGDDGVRSDYALVLGTRK